ncbi:hypothetical protein PENTCL1PPCAC_14441, partial [Pristionchus entomophagus]
EMTAFLDTLLDFLVRIPVLQPFFFIFTSLCSIPIVILLVATQKCALHKNCRYLISFWCISLLGVLLNEVQLNALTLAWAAERGFIPRGVLEPPLRSEFLAIHSLFYVSSSCFEMFIAFERLISTRNPHIYHVSRIHWAVLAPLTVFAYCLGMSVGYIIYLAGYHITGLLIYNTIDLSTLLINTIGIRYCKVRYESLYGKASLNARYQVKEAYDMARAMHPVYFGSFLLKVFAMVIAYAYFLLMSFFNGELYALMDLFYFVAHAFNCAFSSVFLMFLHKSIRQSVLALLGRLLRTLLVVAPDTSVSDTTKKYFTMLEES